MARKKDIQKKKQVFQHEAYIEGSGSVVNENGGIWLDVSSYQEF